MRILTIILFCIWLIVPAASLFVFDRNETIGNKPVKTLANAKARLLSGDAENLEYVMDAIFERSAVTFQAIRAKNALLFYGFRHIDTDDLVSGRDRWLYYKPQFMLSECEPGYYDRQIEVAANGAAVFAAMADVVGTRVIYSLSPNKVRVQPEGVDRRVLAYAGCQAQNEEALDRIFAEFMPEAIFHYRVMPKDAAPPQGYFFRNNTHWNFVGFTNAMYQLKHAIEAPAEPYTPPVLDVSETKVERRSMSTTSNMLLLDMNEKGPLFETPPFAPSSPDWPIKVDGLAVVVHDSFYAFYPELTSAFNSETKLIFRNLPSEEKRVISEFSKNPDLIVFNAVEREMLKHFDGPWGARGVYFEPILDLVMARARRECDFRNIPRLREIDWQGGASTAGDEITAEKNFPDFLVQLPETDGEVCLRISYSAEAARAVDILLPPLANQNTDALWSFGRFFSVPGTKGDNTIVLILPQDMRANQIRVRPQIRESESISNLDVRTLVLP